MQKGHASLKPKAFILWGKGRWSGLVYNSLLNMGNKSSHAKRFWVIIFGAMGSFVTCEIITVKLCWYLGGLHAVPLKDYIWTYILGHRVVCQCLLKWNAGFFLWICIWQQKSSSWFWVEFNSNIMHPCSVQHTPYAWMTAQAGVKPVDSCYQILIWQCSSLFSKICFCDLNFTLFFPSVFLTSPVFVDFIHVDARSALTLCASASPNATSRWFLDAVLIWFIKLKPLSQSALDV